MARDHAAVKVAIWQDSAWRALPANAKLLYLTLLTSPSLSYCGVVDWRPKRIAPLIDPTWTPADVVAAAAILIERDHYIVVDEATEEALVRSFIRNDGLMKQPKLAVSVANAHASTASETLRGVVVHEMTRLRNDYPDLHGWVSPKAHALLEQPSLDPSTLALDPDFGGEFRGPFRGSFTPGVGGSFTHPQGKSSGSVSGSPTPTPSPTPNSIHRTAEPQPSPQAASEFDEFWSHCPKKVGKDAARKAFDKARKRTDAATITAGMTRYATDPNLPERQFIPDPSTWLNAGRWDDEPLPPRTPAPTNVRPLYGTRETGLAYY